MPTVPARSPLLTVEAVALIVLGIIALVLPLFAGLFVSTAVGVLLILSGGIGLVSAFRGGPHWHRGWSITSAVIALVVGLLIVLNPLVGAISLTLLLGAYLLFDGVSLIGLAIDQKKRGTARWGMLALAGVVDIVLALLVLLLGAVGSAVVVGVIVGIDLIAAGGALLLIHRSPLAAPTPLGRPI
jgi:uncharacterized membrane protein HdeD (DUF308 family)